MVGVQFHPEVAHTLIGTDVLRNFIFGICGCDPNWTMHNFVESTVSEIRNKVGTEKVICALSGGVDSAVTAALVHKAIGDQLTCIYVNNGLMRTGETKSLMRFFQDKTHLNVIQVDAEEYFLGELDGVVDPEIKRKRSATGLLKFSKKKQKNWETSNILPRAPCIRM